MHDDERVREVLLDGEGIALRARDDGRAVGPVVDDRDLVRGGALARDESLAHGLAQGNHPVRLANQVSVHVGQRSVDRVAVEILEQGRHLGEDVLAEEHEAGLGSPRREQARQADDRRVGEGNDDIRTAHPQPGETRREEVAHVVQRPAHESLRAQRRAPRPDDLDAVVPLPLEEPAPPGRPASGPGRAQARDPPPRKPRTRAPGPDPLPAR